MISTPVALDETHLTKAEGFGEGFAPFFISLALFVGSLITWLLLRPVPSRALATPAGGLRTALAGFGPAALIGLAQVAVMLGVIHQGLGMELTSVAGTAAFTALVALAFVALQQMLNAVLGPAPGKVAILALLDAPARLVRRHLPGPDHSRVLPGHPPAAADDLRGHRAARGHHGAASTAGCG